MIANDPRARQAGFNALSRDQWDGFAPHRARVTALLVGSRGGSTPGRLCVLGAGNANDLDLPALLNAYREVHLVDLDAGALAAGAAGQGVDGRPGLRLFGGVDLTAMVDAFAAWNPGTPVGPDDLAAMAEAPSRMVPTALDGPYDVVASTCVLSQVIGNAYHSVGEAHPMFSAVVAAIRSGHLRLIDRLLGPGGAGVLITDFVSTDTAPGLAALPDSALPGLVPQLIRDRNFFHGVNPAVLWSSFRHDLVKGENGAGPESVPPWRWSLHDRVYLVVAIRYRKPAGVSPRS